MASLKELRNRIASVQATQKITRAMQMVAASKLRRAQEAAEAARPYADRMGAVLANLAAGVAANDRVALVEGAVLDEEGHDDAAPDGLLRLEDGAASGLLGVGLELEDVGLHRDLLEERGQPLLGLRRDVRREHVAAKLLEDDLLREQLEPDLRARAHKRG